MANRFKRYAWRNYRISSALKHQFFRRFTPAGMLVTGLLFASLATGIDTNLALAYQIATLIGCGLLIAFAWTFAKRPALHAERVLPRFGTAGSPVRYRLTVKNTTNKVQSALAVMEDLGDPRPTLDQFLNNPEPGEEKRNLFDRTFSFYRWMWLMEQNKLGKVEEKPLPTLAPGASADVTLELIPRKRGILRFEGITLAFPDPFGLFRSFRKVALPGQLLILPKRYHVAALAMPGTMRYQEGGVALASSVGESEEFVSLRDYRRGDPLRHIHWKSVSKTGRLIVKEFQDEFFVRHALALDTFVADTRLDVFEEAVSVAASFACTVRTQESLLDLMFVGPQAYCFTIGRGVGHTEQMLEVLASVHPCTSRPFNDLQNLVVQKSADVSGCICVFVAWDEARKGFVKQLRAMGIPLLVLVVTEPNAPDLDAEGLAPDEFRQIRVGKAEEILATL